MWAEVIFRTYYYLHNGRILTDVITIVRIWQNTKEFCGKHLQNTFVLRCGLQHQNDVNKALTRCGNIGEETIEFRSSHNFNIISEPNVLIWLH